MADGGRAKVNKRERIWIAKEDWAEIELAVRRIAKAFGYGDGWRSPTFDIVENQDASEFDATAALAIYRRGDVVEQAAKSIGGSSGTTRQRRWVKRRGIATIPHHNPDPMACAALSFAQLPPHIEAMLMAYALADRSAWRLVERCASHVLPQVRTEAICHAMARLLGRTASIDAMAKVLHLRASAYADSVRVAERLLTNWLIRGAKAYNQATGGRMSCQRHE